MKMLRNWARAALGLSTVALGATTARPGMLNFIEGRAAVDGRDAAPKSAGTLAVEQGQTITTENGRVEMLLTPGVFLRLGENSTARVDSASLTDTRIQLLRGRAYVDADNLRKENRIRLVDENASIELQKDGLYRVDADSDTVSVFDGKATVSQNDQQVELKGGREVNLNGPLTPRKFDKGDAKDADPLYQWSKVRSDYMEQAGISLASSRVISTPGWYWNPMWRTWGFGAPGFYSGYDPFWGPGFGYYGPRYVYRRPVIVRPVPRPGGGNFGGRPGGGHRGSRR